MYMHRKEERGKEEMKGREQKESQREEKKKLEIPVCQCGDEHFLSVPKEESELPASQKAPVATAF